MAKIETTRFGVLEYNESDVLHFEKGIPGFEEEKQFILFQPDQENPLAFLQSIHTVNLAFVIANPFSFYPNYEFELDEQSIAELEIKDVNEVAVWGILSIPENFKKATMNLKAPIIINIKNKKAKQIILHETDYLTKTPLFPQQVKEGVK
ncbi:flagellar assembly protein FliW [Tepidibacillus sp. HK-1]|uniref:flagellar assembly protein FliW n=1 Tax=Tepidibacillus sp. HK-1 TaxID=1883407 RepID=UPI000855AD52|nr:flagellar assembly protein FliW [Tepidibacillus sp. HK-1]GBF10539.1 flagellar assembly factor FliW [Tepidibacillus sp. HK-1]